MGLTNTGPNGLLRKNHKMYYDLPRPEFQTEAAMAVALPPPPPYPPSSTLLSRHSTRRFVSARSPLDVPSRINSLTVSIFALSPLMPLPLCIVKCARISVWGVGNGGWFDGVSENGIFIGLLCLKVWFRWPFRSELDGV